MKTHNPYYKTIVALLASAMTFASCAKDSKVTADPTLTVTEIESPANLEYSQSGESNLTLGADGYIYMSWVNGSAESGFALQSSVRQENSWSAVQTVASGSDWFVNWADFPALAVNSQGTTLNSWLQKSSSETFSYDIKLALADNLTSGWGEPFTPHSDNTETEHGFVSLVALTNDSFGALWLDGRQFVEQGPMSLRYCEVSPTGDIRAEQQLDPRVCDCCQTSLVQTSTGALIAAYRDRSDGEIRDISFVRYDGGEWSKPKTVHNDNWHTLGCPVNGPALAASATNLAVAWFTRDSAEAYVRLVFSTNDGVSFAQPLRIDNGNPEGRVDLAFLDDQTALISWLEIEGTNADSASLYVRTANVDGTIGSATLVTHTSASRASGFAHLVVSHGEGLISWTDTKEPTQVRVAKVILNE